MDFRFQNIFKKNQGNNTYKEGLDSHSDNNGFYDGDFQKETLNVPKNSGLGMTVFNPTSYADVTSVADILLSGTTVVLNVDKLPADQIRRMLDFLAGILYTLHGNLKKVAPTTYIISPTEIDFIEKETKVNP